MKVTVEITENVVERARTLKESLQVAGVKAVLVHGQFDIAKRLADELGCEVIEPYRLKYLELPADTVHVVLIDADLMSQMDARCLETLNFEGTVLAPLASELVAWPEPVSLRQALNPPHDILGRHYLDDDPPRTFACHHMRLKCGNCEGLVNRWITRKRYP